jgi:hypothetical protein
LSTAEHRSTSSTVALFLGRVIVKLGRIVPREGEVMVVARISEAISGTSCPAYRCAHAGFWLFEI